MKNFSRFFLFSALLAVPILLVLLMALPGQAAQPAVLPAQGSGAAEVIVASNVLTTATATATLTNTATVTTTVTVTPTATATVTATPTATATQMPGHRAFLPLTLSQRSAFTVSGLVLDAEQKPLAGVDVVDSSGRRAVTGSDGRYSLSLSGGDHAVAPALEGYSFYPPVLEVDVDENVASQDFTAQAACVEALVNGGFEYNDSGWYFPDSEWPAGYSTDIVHGGARAVRTGLASPLNENRYSYSSVRSSLISIPAGGGGATLRLWLYPLTTEVLNVPAPVRPNGPDFGDMTMAADNQYVVVLDANDQLLETLVSMGSNNRQWSYHEFNLSEYAGRTIKIQAGTYNDGADGMTALYVDDVSLELCPGLPATPTPPPGQACVNYLANSGFEYNTGWNVPYTEYPAAYSTDYAASGVRSMRTGVPMWTYYDYYSYSDAWQTVYIPWNITRATLHMDLLPLSQEPYWRGPTELPKEDLVWGEAPLGEAPLGYDVQYLLVLDPYSQQIIEYLMWWTSQTSSGWLSRDFDLTRYAGRTIRLQFGTYNNGNGLRTAMYVDNAVLDVCSGSVPPTPTPFIPTPTFTPMIPSPTPTWQVPTATPTTAPPPLCSELVYNNSFEAYGVWEIPLTAFSAGYSNAAARSGYWSMRTGILSPYHNRYSYSDFRQTIYVPAGSYHTTLNFWAYPISGEAYSAPTPERPTSAEFGNEAMSGDVQYLLVLDRYGNWIDTLLWRRSNAQYWQNFVYDLSWYAGNVISLQWGTYNNGWSGVSSMFIDDVSVQACP